MYTVFKALFHKRVCVLVRTYFRERMNLDAAISSCLEAEVFHTFFFPIGDSVNYKSSYPDVSFMEICQCDVCISRWHIYFNNHHAVTINCVQKTMFETNDRKRNTANIMTLKLKKFIFFSQEHISDSGGATHEL